MLTDQTNADKRAPDNNTAAQKVGADICEYKKRNYLIIIDCFCQYLEISHLPDMKNIFARWGCPDELYTDNG